MSLVIYLGSDTLLKLEGFRDEVTGYVITGATVTADLFDASDDSSLGPQISFTDQGAGLYTGTVADDHAGLAEGMRVRIELVADAGAGQKLSIRDFATVVVADAG